MSKELQKYSQKQSNMQNLTILQGINANFHKNNIYYPFQTGQPAYYYNYMYPYTDPTCLPFYSPTYDNPYDTFPYQPSTFFTKIEESDHNTINQLTVKAQIAQQQNYCIKIQDEESNKKEIQYKPEPVKPEEKINRKQLYFAGLNQGITKISQQDIAVLLNNFKKIVEDHIEENIEEGRNLSTYEPQFSKQIAEDKQFFGELMNALTRRFKGYKKTKEELIKFIIRRTYHNLKTDKNILCQKPEYQRLEAFHEKNLATFKSMNIQFLKREFSNQLFVQLFKEFIVNLDDQFEKENQEKVERFGFILVNCWLQKSISLLIHQRKLPWVNSYKIRIKKISCDLLKEYEGSSLKDFEPSKIIKK